MANTHTTLASLFTDIADVIREKEKSTEAITADDFPERIAAMNTGPAALFWEGNKERENKIGLIYTRDAEVTGEKVISPGTVSGEKLIID